MNFCPLRLFVVAEECHFQTGDTERNFAQHATKAARLAVAECEPGEILGADKRFRAIESAHLHTEAKERESDRFRWDEAGDVKEQDSGFAAGVPAPGDRKSTRLD